MILAGGKGSRLEPLTRERSKPSVPFGGRYRIVDFVLSNFVNSRVLSLYVLVQYKSQSLIEHLRMAWQTSGLVADHFIAVVPPQMRIGEMWYRGSADAVLQNLNLVDDFEPDLVAVFGADHIYRMDVNQMVAFHRAQDADVTVAARPVPVSEASDFGVLAVDATGRVVDFVEKPKAAAGHAGGPEALPWCRWETTSSRAGPSWTRWWPTPGSRRTTTSARASSPRSFRPPASSPTTSRATPCRGSSLTRSPGTGGTWGRSTRTGGPTWTSWARRRAFDLDNRRWPIHAARYDGPPARIIGGEFENAQVGEGALVLRATIRNSILGRGVWVNEGAVIEDSIVMDFTSVGKGAHLRRAVVDRYNIIPAGQQLGLDPAADRERYRVDPSGLVVVPRGGRREFLWDTEAP